MSITNETAVIDVIAHHADVTPEKLAAVDLASGRRMTYAQMHERVGRLAAYMQSLGVRKGDRVAFMMLNSTDILDIIFAAWRIGASVLALNYRLTAPELEFIVNDATPRVLFHDEDFNPVIDELRPLVEIHHYVSLDGVGGASDFEQGIAASVPIYDRVPQCQQDMCMLMYSSGTTGRPKGVIITYDMLFYSAVNGVAPMASSSDAVWLSAMPLFHIGGLNVSSLPALWIGGTNVVMRAFTPDAVFDVFDDAELGVTHTILVPAMYIAMRMHPRALTTDYSRLVGALAGGASVPKELIEWWAQHGLLICEGYGMTESAASNCIVRPDDLEKGVGTSGKALLYTQMRIVGPDGKDVPRGEPGEIWMRGPTITPGYWNNDAANRDSFVDGWFRSGDIARQDEEGRFIIEDREKDMYISGGENVYPAEVEGVLYEIEAIAEVAVIGVDDEKWGETGCAVTVLKEGYSLTLEDLKGHCEGRLGRFKHPSHLFLLDELPRNTTGKVKKFELRASVPEQLRERA